MRGFGAFVVLFAGAALSSAQLNETFSYPNGNLTTVSVGAWEKWDEEASGDATVAGGVARIEDNTDVIRYFNNVFASSTTAQFSFDINVSTSNSSEDYQVYFSPASSPAGGLPGQNYLSSLGLLFDNDANGTLPPPPPGAVYVSAYEGTGSVHGTQFAAITSGVTHTVSGTMTKGAGIVNYTLFVDGVQLRASSFIMTDARGINAVEFYQGRIASPTAFATLDNISVTPVPEPASVAVLGLGALAVVRRRRARGWPGR